MADIKTGEEIVFVPESYEDKVPIPGDNSRCTLRPIVDGNGDATRNVMVTTASDGHTQPLWMDLEE